MSIKDNYPIVSPSLSLDFANTKVLDSRITFSRPTSSVYYDGQTVSLAEQNLVLQSQTFDNASWNKASSITVTSNASNAPDGTLTASALLETATTGTHFVYQTATTQTATVQNFSAYIKANGRDFATVGVSTSGTSNYYSVTINLTSGVITQELKTGAVGASGSAIVISVGGGWYRVSTTTIGAIYVIVGSASQGTFTSTNSGFENYLGDITKGIYAWGAQLEQRDTVTAYQPTTTQPITNYIPTLLTAPANSARFDHNPVTGESLGLLVEELRTNLVLRSEEFDNVAWTKSNATVTADTIVAPDGTLTGDLLSVVSSGRSYILSSANTASNTVLSGSIFVKAGNQNNVCLTTSIGNVGVRQWFNLATATSGSAISLGGVKNSSEITSIGNDWYRISLSITASAGTVQYLILDVVTGDNVLSGNSGDNVYIWGAQLEAGSFPTSYIKTEASQVTRSADSASMTGANFSDWYRQDEGSIYVEGRHTPNGGYRANYIAFNNGTGNEEMLLTAYIEPPYINATVISLNAYQAVLERGPFVANTFNTMSLAYKVNDFALSANASTVVNDSTGLVCTPTQMIIGAKTVYSGYALSGTIKKISYYPQRLSNENLQALTS